MMSILTNLGFMSHRHAGTALGSQWLNSQLLLPSYSPHDDSLVGEVEQTTPEQLTQIVTSAHAEFLRWRNVPAPQRGELIRLIGDKLRAHKADLANLIVVEMGKPKAEAEGEVQEMIDMANLASGQARMLYGLTMHSERANHRMYEQWHPLGVVAVFSAFNFPVAVWAWNAFLAAICGNTVVWKPSPLTPLSAVAVHKLCVAVMTEHGYGAIFSLVTSADNELATKLVDNTLVPLVAFTGSTAVGQTIAARVAQRCGRAILELGGNNAAIVDASVDLDQIIPAITFAAIGTTGQRCTSLRRLIVHQSIYQQTSERLVAAYQQLKIGDPRDVSNHLGPLINFHAVSKFSQALTQVAANGGELIVGGKVLQGNYVTPAIVAAKPEWGIVQEETFAPILYLLAYATIEEAIAINNQVAYGLSSAIFTHDLCTAEEFLSVRGSDCGIANVNIGTSGAEIGGAFGGEKASGGGREAGSDAWKAYMRRQTTTINYGSKLTLAQGIQFNL